MKRILDKLEVVVNKIIPYLIIILLIILVLDFTTDYIKKYHLLVAAFDVFVVSAFVIDLIFKYNHLKNKKKFVRLYWLDILAVFPIYLLFRAYATLAKIFLERQITQLQQVTHVAVTIEREAAVLEKEAMLAKEAKLAKFNIFGRILRAVQRLLRLIAARFKLVHAHLHKTSLEQEKK